MMGLPLKINPEEPSHGLYEGIEYKEFWNGLQRRKLDELEHAIVRDLLPVSGRRIIDVGCGYGRLADCYIGRFQQVIMLDGSMSLLNQAFEQTGGQAICIAGDVTHLPFRPASFDTILMVRVFHHITDTQACLSGLYRILCNDGRFIFSYRNKRNALHAAQWLVGRNTENPFSTEPAGVGSTLISHHPSAVHRMLLKSGFADIRYYGAGVFDWLAGKLGSMGRLIPPGRQLAGLLGRIKIAPWILCGAIARRTTSLIDTTGIDDLLQCPSCGGGLSGGKQGYLCLMCDRHYPIEDGIIDLRV
jgi:ubiquinone/menaquinone biosynthesis C-methylase UbiE